MASGDCERVRRGLVGQPANTVSSLAFVAVGVPLARRSRRGTRALGWAAVATGLGSVAYHGPGTDLGRYAHDGALIALLGLVALDDAVRARGREAPPAAIGVVVAAAAVGGLPGLTAVVQSVAGGLAVAAGVARTARRGRADGAAPLVGLAALVVGGALQAAGRTGGPLCEPDRPLQPHAGWHVLAAVGVLLRHLG